MDASWLGTLELWGHGLNELDDLEVVCELVDVGLHLVNSLALFRDELLVVKDVLFNSVEKEVHGLLLLLLDGSDVSGEDVDIGWLVDFDVVLLALLDEELDSPLSLVAELHPGCVGEGESVLVFVQIDEMSKVEVSERFDNAPGVILWNC